MSLLELETHCWQERGEVGRAGTLWREGPVALGCFAGALPVPLRSALVGDEQQWYEVVHGAGALMFHANSFEEAHAGAQSVVAAVDDGVLLPPPHSSTEYWVLRESVELHSSIVVLFPRLFMLPCLALAIVGRAAVVGKHAVPYTGGKWRAVGEGRMWSDAAPPNTTWLRTPPHLHYCRASGPNLIRELTRREQATVATFHPSWRACWAECGLAMKGMLSRTAALATHNGVECMLYFVEQRTYKWDGTQLTSLHVDVRPSVTVDVDAGEDYGYERVWPVSSVVGDFPFAESVRALPTSPLGHVSTDGCGVRWWAPVQSEESRTLLRLLPTARYESVGANDHIVLVFEAGMASVEEETRNIVRRLWTAFQLASDPPQPLHADDGADFIVDGAIAIMTFAARRAYRPLLRELVADYAAGRKLRVRCQHWLPLSVACRHLYGTADRMRHLAPANRWGCALEDSLQWPELQWWDPERHRGPALYADCEVAVWVDSVARRWSVGGEWYWLEDMQRRRGEWVRTFEQFPFVRRLSAQYYHSEYRRPGEQVVGTHALVRIGWGGVCRGVRPVLGHEKMSDAIDAHLSRLTPMLDEHHVHPTVVSERFNDIRAPGREGLTVVPMVAPCGAGKSTAALALAEEMLQGRWRALFVSPRQSVVEQTLAQLRAMRVGVIDGRDKEALARNNVGYVDCCVTTIHSLHKLLGTFVQPQHGAVPIVLFFDEVVTAFSSDYNSHIIPAERAERSLMRLLAGPVKIAVLMDANLTPLIVGNFIERYVYGVRKMVGSSLCHLSVHVHPKVATYNMAARQSRSAVCYTAFDAPLQIFRELKERLLAGRKVAIFFSRKKSLDVWQRAFIDVVPQACTLVYNGESKVPLGELCTLMQRDEVQLFMYTTAAGAGVDVAFIDEEGEAVRHFNVVAMIGASAPYLSPKDLEQAASRVRCVPEILVDLAGAEVTGPFETMMSTEWRDVMETDEEAIMQDALHDANYTSLLARRAQLDESVWLQAPPVALRYGDTSPYARLLAYNRLAIKSTPFRCQAFVSILARIGYATRLVVCPLPSEATLDASSLLLKAELLCDLEEGDDQYNHVLANQRRGAIGLPALHLGEPYVQRLEECVRRLAERGTMEVVLKAEALFSRPLPRTAEDWADVVRTLVEEMGVRQTIEGRRPLGQEGVALREVLTDGREGKRVLQALALYVSSLACGLGAFLPEWEGRHEPALLCPVPLLSRLGRGEVVLTLDSQQWLADAEKAGGPLYLPRHHRRATSSVGRVLNGYCVSLLGAKFYKVVKRGNMKVDDPHSRLALWAVLALRGRPTAEATTWLEEARRDTLEHPRDLTMPLPAESAPQSRKRKRLEKVESQLQLAEGDGEEEPFA